MGYFYWLRLKSSNHLHTKLNLGYLKGTKFCLESKASFIDISRKVHVIFQKLVLRVSSGFQTLETFETTRPKASWFHCFRTFGNLMKPEARVFEITSQTKKISLNYHLNKFSQFKCYI